MSSFSVKRFEGGGLATVNGDDTVIGDVGDDTLTGDGVLPSLLEGATIADINAAAVRQFASQDRMKALINEAKARISQQRAPSVWGALSEGLAQPKTQPGISGTLANISSGLSQYRKGKSAFDEAQAEKLLAYQLKQEELQGARATTEGTTATRLATLAAAQARAATTAAEKAAKKTGALTAKEKTAYNLDPKAPYFWKDDLPVLADAVKPLPLTADEQADKIAAATEARILATDAAKAKTMLPKARSSAERALAGIDSILNHPGLSAVVGLPDPTKGGLGFVQIPGTPAANFQARLDQLKGGAFLEAYNILKGGGQISNTEGTKAEAAIVRASAAQTEVEFRQAMNDFRDAIRTGLANLETSASGAAFDIGRAPPAAPAGAAPATVRTSSGAKLTPEQATQRLLNKGYTLKNGTLVAPSGVSG
jgi:hypothetical protein